MKRIVLKRTGQRPLEFEGELLATAETSPDRASSRWSGVTGRWWEVKLYQTRGGKYVVYVVHYTNWQGERDEYEVRIFASLEEALSYLEREMPRAAEEITEELEATEHLE